MADDKSMLDRVVHMFGFGEDIEEAEVKTSNAGKPANTPPPPAAKEFAASQAASQPVGELKAEAAAKDFLNRLMLMLGEQRDVLSGNINLVGLQDIRAQLGDDWPRHADLAQEVAQSCIRRALAPDDIFLRYDELRFLIVFGRLTREQAQLKCLEIAAEIGKRLLGEAFSEAAAKVETAVFENDGTVLFSTLNRKTLLDRLTGALPAKAAPAPEEPPPDTEMPVADFSFAQIDKAKALASIRILYRAMWDHRRRAITTYFAAPTAANVFGRIVQDADLRREFAEVLPPLEFDVFVSRCVLRDMAEFIAGGRRVLLCWPLDYESIAPRQSRMMFAELCRDIPAPVRQLMLFELNDLPEGAPQSRILDVISALKPYCRAVYLRVTPSFRNFAGAAAAGVAGIGFALGPPGYNEAAMRAMHDFARDCSRHNLRSYVRGLTLREHVQAAINAGIDYIDGPAVDRPMDLPGPMRRFDIDEIYGKSGN